MALTRAMLKGMGLTDEQVNAIIEEHTAVTGSLKEQIGSLKEKSETFDEVQKELNEIKSDIKKNNWQKKYEEEHKAFDDYKTEVANKEKSANIKLAYKKLLADCKVGEKHVDSIIRVTDFSKMELDEDGTFKNADKLKEAITSDWSGFISSKETKGAEVDTPPGEKENEGSKKTGRAAELAAKYHDNLYGKVKED